ncbi:WD40 repeat domain-containing protein [Dactylosporangium sp. NPDC049525]|uniref:WD40 repeat domain-containing protein n=1 Tax=Dactylosporangium sp. NPDC049525 TaxID=3154730 RepID=UPI003423EDE7
MPGPDDFALRRWATIHARTVGRGLEAGPGAGPDPSAVPVTLSAAPLTATIATGGPVHALAVRRLADGRVALAVGTAEGLCVVDLATRAVILRSDALPVHGVAFVGDDAQLVWSGRQTLNWTDIATASTESRPLTWPGTYRSSGLSRMFGRNDGDTAGRAVAALAELPGGSGSLLVLGQDGGFYVANPFTSWRDETGMTESRTRVAAGMAVGWSAGRPPVLVVGQDGSVVLDGLRVLDRPPFGPVGRQLALAVGELPGNARVCAAGDNDGWIHVWTALRGPWGERFQVGDGAVRSLALARLFDGGVVLAVADEAGAVRICDPRAGTVVAVPDRGDEPGHGPLASAVLPDGSVLLVAGTEGGIRIWTLQSDRPADGAALVVRGRFLLGDDDADPVSGVATDEANPGTVLLVDVRGVVRAWRFDLAGPARLPDRHDAGWPESARIALVDAGGRKLIVSAERDGVEVWERGDRGGRLLTLPEEGVFRVAATAMRPDLLVVVAASAGRPVAPAWILQLTSDIPEAEPLPVRLPVCALGVAALSEFDVCQPLGLLADLVAMLGGGRPAAPELHPLETVGGFARLRELDWSLAARVGLAGLLLADLPAEAGFVPPPGDAHGRLAAIRAALATPPGPVTAPDAPLTELREAAERVDDQLLTLLSVLGEHAIAADPALPVRMRHRAAMFPPLGRLQREVLSDSARLARQDTRSRAGVLRFAPVASGVSRRGRVTHLLPTQLALPAAAFALRFARRELLYRLHEDTTEPVLPSVTLVLDTTPATFGPVEAVLRTMAHVITAAMWEVWRFPSLVCLDQPQELRTLAAETDLVAVWGTRTLEPPDLATALETAGSAASTLTVVLTEQHAAREHAIVPTAGLRLLTTNVPGDPPPRRVANRFHAHVSPQPSTSELARSVATMLGTA